MGSDVAAGGMGVRGSAGGMGVCCSSAKAMRPPRFFRGGVWAKARCEVCADFARHAELLDEFNEEHLLPPWLEPLMRELHSQRSVTGEMLASM